jgi:hypothetical protein
MLKRKKDSYVPETNCFLCKKPSNFRDHPDSRKDFICSLCTLVMANNPRSDGQKWGDLIPASKKDIDADLQRELSDVLKI